MAAKKQKLDSQFNTDRGQVSNIFEGISIYINGYTSKCNSHSYLLPNSLII